MTLKILIIFIIFVFTSQSVKQYRSDYEYNSKLGAFFKLHTEEVDNRLARESCENEYAKLMVPTPRNVVQVHGMLKQFSDVYHAWVDNDGLSHESNEFSEEILNNFHMSDRMAQEEMFQMNTCEVLTRTGDVKKLSCSEQLPFICMVEEKDVPYDPHCKVYSKGYHYVDSVGSCYKISTEVCTWNQAYEECQAEGAHLVVLNSVLEHDEVHNLTLHAPPVSVLAQSPWYWHAGMRAQKTTDGSSVVYKTIFGQTLSEAGYDQWSVGEPNNLRQQEFCGSIYKDDGKYNDVDCTQLFAFICEKNLREDVMKITNH